MNSRAKGFETPCVDCTIHPACWQCDPACAIRTIYYGTRRPANSLEEWVEEWKRIYDPPRFKRLVLNDDGTTRTVSVRVSELRPEEREELLARGVRL